MPHPPADADGRIRVLLVDDHRLVLEGVRRLLEADFLVVGLAENGHEALQLIPQLEPDVVVLDISLPMLSGLEVARRVKLRWPQINVVFLTMHLDAAYVTSALHAGAAGYVHKSSPPAELREALRTVVRGAIYITSLIDVDAADIRQQHASGQPRGLLTPRQLEVLQLVAEGRTSREIGELLHTSVKTVEFHKANVRKRLGVSSTAELARVAVKMGIVDA